MRRKEFLATEMGVLEEILERSRYGHLATLEDGSPRAVPLNFVVLGQHIYLHGSPEGVLARQAGHRVSFTAQDMACWIPSTWRHPHNACPATTFYRSVGLLGELQTVSDLQTKAQALELFMTKYQPQGGHRPIRADHRSYAGPLRSLQVSRLPWHNAVVKVKVGQHLTPEKRIQVFEKLRARALPEDRWISLEMARVEPELLSPHWVEDPRKIPMSQLQALVGPDQSLSLAQQMNDAHLTLAYVADGVLLAYACLAKGSSTSGFLVQLVVKPDQRRQGLGSQLVKRLLNHPASLGLNRVFVEACQPLGFFEPLGFRCLEENLMVYGVKNCPVLS